MNMEKKRLEAMAEEIDFLRSVQLFSNSESQEIMRIRKEHDSKIHSAAKEVKYFLDYIKYETDLYQSVKQKSEKKNLLQSNRNVLLKMIKRLKTLFETALQKFSSDTTLLEKFLSFCRKFRYTQEGSDMVSNIYKKHFDNPEICQVCARWCAIDEKNLKSAVSKIMRTISHNEKSELLYKELIEIDLLKLKGVALENESLIKNEIFYKFDSILTTVFKLINNHNFYIEILNKLENHEFTGRIQVKIINHLIKEYYDNAEVWHALGQHEQRVKYSLPFAEDLESPNHCTSSGESSSVLSLPGRSCSDDNASLSIESRMDLPSTSGLDDLLGGRSETASVVSSESSESTLAKKRTPKARLEACFARYREGLKKISPEKKAQLWELFINFLFILKEDRLSGGSVLKLHTLKNALQEASHENNLSAKHYLAWVENLLENDDDKKKLLAKATASIPNSVDLWVARLQIVSLDSSVSVMEQVFKSGCTALNHKASPLWKIFLQYHTLRSDAGTIEKIYSEGVLQPKEVSATLKCLCLDWLVINRSLPAARKAYLLMANREPFCKELHETMSKIETTDVKPRFETGERIYKYATEQFGHEDIDVWVNYLKFIIQFPGNLPDNVKWVDEILSQAKNKLPRYLYDDVVEEYNKISALKRPITEMVSR